MGISSVEDKHFPRNNYLKIRDKLIDLSKPKILGIVNVTPDSFYSKSRKTEEKELLQTVNQMIEDGTDWIDLGGFSTRPHAKFVSEEDEINRITDPIKLIKKEFPDLIVSLDTFRASTAKRGIDLGVDIINDISGFQFDPDLFDVIVKENIPYILMHAPHNFELMHEIETDIDIFKKVILFLSEKINLLTERGVTDILIDPGFGFGKTIEQNHQLMRELDRFKILGHPILVGISRKSMITKKLGIEATDALNGTTVLNTEAILKGASVLRVHDVKETKQLIDLLV